jgi:tetratricopeptide (TPR) repeat protein
MIRFNRFNQGAALCALLACLSLSAAANDFQEANKLFKNGQDALALSKIDAILLNQPKDAQARFLKGVILTEQGQTEESMRIFLALTEDYPELPEPYNNLAVLYASQGQYDKAKVALEKAIRTNPSYATANENLGDIYAKMASQAYDRALQLDRSNTSSKTKLALVKDLFNPTLKPASGSKTQIASAAVTTTMTAPASATPAAAAQPAAASVVAAAKPVTEPQPAKTVVATTAAAASDEALKAVHSWASAWSARNVNKYLSMYAKEFKVPNNETRKSWEQQRRERIAKPQPIVVSISNASVKMLNENHAHVSFVQSYRSGALKSMTRKSMEMIKAGGVWQILSERTGA